VNRRAFKRQSGFTLLEISLTVVIGLLMLSLAIPSMRGLFAEQRLRERMEVFEQFVGRAAALARSSRKEVRLRWEEGGVRMVQAEAPPDDLTQPAAEGGEWFALAKDESLELLRTAARDAKPLMEWSFWKEGVREPAEVLYNGPGGSWALRFGALLPEPDVLSVKAR
jgi:prepilin-type N-terminal cleavage/methylation domain-containing protein